MPTHFSPFIMRAHLYVQYILEFVCKQIHAHMYIKTAPDTRPPRLTTNPSQKFPKRVRLCRRSAEAVTCHFAKEGLTVLITDGRVYIRNRACAMSLGFLYRSYTYVRLDVVDESGAVCGTGLC